MIVLRDDSLSFEAGETPDIGFDFSDYPEARAGERVASAALEVAPGGPTFSAPAVLAAERDGMPPGLGVVARASDLAPGSYRVRCLALWTSGAGRTLTGTLVVRE